MSEQNHDIQMIVSTNSGNKIKVPATVRYDKNRIWFVKSPFALKDEIKAMKAARWHGYEDPPQKMWSVEDCPRNRFHMECLTGGNPYARWDKPLLHWEYDRPLREHQKLMSDHMLTYHYAIIAAEMGTGKTLSAIECMEQSDAIEWWWVAPKSAIKAVQREFHKWGLSDEINLTIMTFDKLRAIMKEWTDGTPPQGIIFDESSRLKNSYAQRTVAAQNLADLIRKNWGDDGFVIEMSGTPSPKSPVGWWSQAEIAWPGFIREGDAKAFERRLGIFVEKETMQGKHWQRVSWLDDENKCNICGGYVEDEQHVDEFLSDDYHTFVSSKNEVSYLYERLQGLTLKLLKKDCLDLPEKIYRTVRTPPSTTLQRVAKGLVKVAPTVITGLTWLRELSDGFQYKHIEDGMTKCPVCNDGTTPLWVDPDDEDKTFEMVDMLDDDYVATLVKTSVECQRCDGTIEVPKIIRTATQIPCPKDGALKDLLEENEEQGRLVVFAGFTGSIDRIVDLCLKQKWAVVRVDGRGWKVYDLDGNPLHQEDALEYWADLDNARVVFVAHPQSGGLGLTLTESRMAVFYSNDWNPESRLQAEDRIHRMGTDMNKGATIVDLIHLPSDEHVRDVLQDNRRLELLTLGEIENMFNDEEEI
jgi:SNF2 family DNA or RNA helicase